MGKHNTSTRRTGVVPRSNGLFALIGIGFFFLLAAQAGGSDKHIAVAAVVLFLACSIGRAPARRLGERLSIPVLAVFAYLLLNGAASLYSRFGSFAGTEFSKILAALCVYGVVLVRAKREDAPRLAAMTASVTAAFSLLSLDAAAGKLLAGPFFRLMDALGCQFQYMSTGYEEGVRITGILGNPNVLGGMLALGVLLSFYLAMTARTTRSRVGASMLLGINTLGFLLAFSMGAIAMFMVSVLLYLLAAPAGKRLSLFLLMAQDAVVSLVMMFVAFQGLGKNGALGMLPVLAAVAAGGLIYGVQRLVGDRLAAVLASHGKAAGITVAVLAVLAVSYVVLGYQLSGGIALNAGEDLRRSVYPAPGTYTLEGSWEGPVSVVVESQNASQTIMHTSTVLYSGDLEGASFTVPEDSKVVYLNLSAPEGANLESLSLSSGEKVRLGYLLLPEFAANRIQGLWANQNAIQRVEFWRDGLKIYQESPIIGNGLGCVEGMVTQVQSFYYASRYVHNHYIQVLAEMGIPGLLVFLTMLGSSAVMLLRRRREGEEDLLLSTLLACLVMLALHGAVEAVWSISAYQALALLLLGVMAVCYGRPVAKLSGKAAGWIALGGLWLFQLVFGWFVFNYITASRQYEEIQAGVREQTPYTMSNLAARDHYGWAQYKLDMAVNAATSEVPEFRERAAEYARELRRLKIHSVNYSLEKYHYADLGQYEELFAASREGIPQKASVAETWQEEFDLYREIFPWSAEEDRDRIGQIDWYVDQILLTWQMLEEYNAGRLEQITLSEENQVFVEQMKALDETGVTGEAALALLAAMGAQP